MTPSLTQRYIAAMLKNLPSTAQADIRSELEASIIDAVEARVNQGEDLLIAEKEVITELGDPAVLAAEYTGRRLYLIGPRFFLTWWSLLRLLLSFVPATVATVVALAEAIGGSSIGDIISRGLIAGASTAIQLCFWTTLVFALLERGDAQSPARWNPDLLPSPSTKPVSLSDTVVAVVGPGLLGAAIVWDQSVGFLSLNGVRQPLLNPGLWPAALSILLVILALSAALGLYIYARGSWSLTNAMANVTLNVLLISWLLTTLGRGILFDPSLTSILSSYGMTLTGQRAVVALFACLTVGACVWDSIDGWLQSRQELRH